MTIAGAFNWPGEEPDIARSLSAMALQAGRPRLQHAPGLVLGHCDEAEIASDGPITALFHGRLDSALGPAGSGAEAVLAAYQHHEKRFASALIGEFACVVWDGRARCLYLVRDALGQHPLHFWKTGKGIVFATEPQGLLALPQVPREIDERWLARSLALLPQEDGRTTYRGIERVQPGHLMIVTAQDLRQERYWRPEELPPVRLKDAREYAETARTLLDEAIRCRIAGAQTVGSHLSAGLDSSSVTALTARQLAEKGQRLLAFTAVPDADFDGSAYRSRIWDEGPLARQVAELYPNIDHILVSNGAGSLFDSFDETGATGMPVMNPMNQIWTSAIGRAAQQRGVSVLLDGGMGNMSISYDGFGFLARLARTGDWITLAGHLAALHRQGTAWRSIANRIFIPLLPQHLRRRVRRALGRPEAELRDFSALRPEFAEPQGVFDEAVAMAGDVSNSALGQQDVRLAVINRVDSAMYRRADRRRFGFIFSDPTADQRLVEFCLAIPPEQFFWQGESRSLVRRMMQGLLPEAVRLERRKGLQAADWSRRAMAAKDDIAAEIDRLERHPLASACLDLPRLRRLVDNWPTGGWHRTEVAQAYQLALMRGIATGRFLRRFTGGNE
jgi:asparagine synthase (glutamine-hydrolysing)